MEANWVRAAARAAATVGAAVLTAVTATPASAAAPLQVVDLGTLGGECCSSAAAINDHGQVVGTSDVGPGEFSATHAFRWEDGRMTDLGTLSGYNSWAAAINDRGDAIAGTVK